MIYLDCNATTPLEPDIEKIMIQEHETAELDRFKIKELNDI